jgi:hypothetical protein
MHDPRKFYASDSPVFNNSDSDQELYKSAEESLGPEDQGDEQVGGHSVGLHVSYAQPVSVSTNNPKASATVRVIPVPSRVIRTAQVTRPTTFLVTIVSGDVAFVPTISTSAVPRSAQSDPTP